MRQNLEKKVSKQQLNEARRDGNSLYGDFRAYCRCHSSCDTCNRRVRRICKIKDTLENIQVKIIRRICKEVKS